MQSAASGGWMSAAAALAVLAAAGPPQVPGAAPAPIALTLSGGGPSIRVWHEPDEGGRLVPVYSISSQGRPWSRPRRTSYEILLRYDAFDPAVRQPPVPAALAAPAARDAEERIEIVQFITQPLPEYRDAITGLGGRVLQYLAQHAHLVRMTPAVSAQVRELPFVRWVGPYHPAYRLEGALVDPAAGIPPQARYNIMVFEAGPVQKAAVAARIEAMGGTVNRPDAGRQLLEATLAPAQLLQAAAWNEVLFIDRWSAWGTDMDLAREIGGANYVEGITGFSGQGVRGEVIDAGFNIDHGDLQSPPLLLHTPVDVHSHGAATSGIVFGDGTFNPVGRGMLPDAQGIAADADVVFLGLPRYDHTAQLRQAPWFAVFQSSSVGNTQVTEYTTISADTDAMLFDFDVLHCQSQSNTGNQESRPQAWAKNIVSVGGIRHQDTLAIADDCWGCGPTAASIGPAEDGRIKPDLCHFYDNVFTTTSGAPDAYTPTFGGTSAATPIVAGHFGIFFQMWADGLFGYPVDPAATVFDNRPHMTTAKAMLIITAEPYAFDGESHDLTRVHQGWGMPSLRNLYDRRDRMFIVDETDLLGNLESAVYALVVNEGEPAARFTLTWADPPGVPASARHRVNDLSLRVTSPSGTVYWGNQGLLSFNWSVAGGAADTVDTVENVLVESPQAGTWTVEVLADEINEDGHLETPMLDADFALVASGVQQVLPAMVIRLPDGAPGLVAPGVPADIAVRILDGAETLVPGSAALHYRFDPGDSFTAIPLAHLVGPDYVATLPGPSCAASPQFYFSAAGDGGTVVTEPGNAPDSLYEAGVGIVATVLSDDFETDQGWTVENDAGLTDGAWDRGVPAGGGDRGDPPQDFDGSGNCFLTDNVDGNSDVDGGATSLISPVYDLTGLDAQAVFGLWYSNNVGSAPNEDVLRIYVSDDGGSSWVLARTIGPASGTGWSVVSVPVSDFVVPGAGNRFRFEASDLGEGSVVEAAIDAFRITTVQCADPGPADLDSDGQIGVTDLLALLAAWGTDPGGPPDLDGDGIVGVTDLLSLLAGWGPC